MVGLIDIVPVDEKVVVRGKPVSVSGVSVEGIGRLLFRFPELRKMAETGKWNADELLTLSDDIVCAILAAGTGMPGNVKAEAGARNLSVGEKAALIAAVIRVTMPQGVGPFTTALTEMFGSVSAASQSVGARDTKSRKPQKH